MMKSFIGRENEIFKILKRLKKVGYILIGGYAVSAYQHRFSVDADLVVKGNQLKEIIGVLKENKFKSYKSRRLENVYGGRFESFVKKEDLPVTVDLLVNAVTSRQTNASWSFELLRENSVEEEIEGIEKSVKCKIPVKELLIAMKIHSARLTDIRDIVALCEEVDGDKIVRFCKRGDLKKLKENVLKIKENVDSDNFADSFKGVFSLEKVSGSNLKVVKEVISKLSESL